MLLLCVTGLPLIFQEEIEHLGEEKVAQVDLSKQKVPHDELESKGVEFELSAYLIKGFSLLAGVSYNDMKYIIADADVVNRRPSTASSPWLVNFDASYQFLDGSLKGLGFGIGGNYASDNKIVNSVSMGTFILPEYFVLNAHAFYDAPKYRVSLKVDNLTNEKYWNGYTTANAQIPLNVVGSLAFKF